LPYKDAYQMLSFDNARKIMQEANEFLEQHKELISDDL